MRRTSLWIRRSELQAKQALIYWSQYLQSGIFKVDGRKGGRDDAGAEMLSFIYHVPDRNKREKPLELASLPELVFERQRNIHNWVRQGEGRCRCVTEPRGTSKGTTWRTVTSVSYLTLEELLAVAV